jgi:menaquinone-dependent protoporphyrinogen oxidase
MRVLVTAASKHGGTWEIAEAIRDRLQAADLTVELMAPQEVQALEGIDVVVLGSGVYAGRWLREARELVDRLQPDLRQRRVWLFSSGPLGDPPLPQADPADAAPMMEACGAEAHQVFAGRLERARLGFAERAVVAALRAPEGDDRDWAAIGAWADGIAEALRPGRAVPAVD